MTDVNSDNDSNYTQYFSRHLVGMGWYEGPVNTKGEYTRKPDYHCASGFLLQVYKTYYLVTAGHVLTDYHERKKNGYVGKHHSLLDFWSPKATFWQPIPFDFTDAPVVIEDSPERGIDVAIIKLPSFILEALLQTIVPFTHERWLYQDSVSFDFYAILGSPVSDATQRSGSDGPRQRVETFLRARVIFVDKCTDPPSDTQETEFQQFVGQINPNETINDIVGTSGGPVLGFCKDEVGLLYWPVAIQSRWRPKSRIVIGTSIPIIALGIHEWIKDLASQTDQFNPPPPTLLELSERYGSIPANRIRLDRFPATEADVEELHARENRLYELVDGVLLEKTMGFREGYLAGWILTLLNNFVEPRDLGIVAGADGMLRLAPGLVRIPDVSFIRWEQFPERNVPETPVPDLYPDLAVEVLSIGNSAKEMREKYEDYFEAGAELVWEVDPFRRLVKVYSSLESFVMLSGTQTLTGGQVLPGFAIPVSKIFEKLALIQS